jgi:putative NADH-flavin reductase
MQTIEAKDNAVALVDEIERPRHQASIEGG